TNGRLNVLSNLNLIILAFSFTTIATATAPGRWGCVAKPKALPPTKTGEALPAGTQTPAFSSNSQSEAEEMDWLVEALRQLVEAVRVRDMGWLVSASGNPRE